MSYAFIDCESHAHTMEVKICTVCRHEAHNTVHYEDRCDNYCDEHRPVSDRFGRQIEWYG